MSRRPIWSRTICSAWARVMSPCGAPGPPCGGAGGGTVVITGGWAAAGKAAAARNAAAAMRKDFMALLQVSDRGGGAALALANQDFGFSAAARLASCSAALSLPSWFVSALSKAAIRERTNEALLIFPSGPALSLNIRRI